jgi:hypothetical protein
MEEEIKGLTDHMEHMDLEETTVDKSGFRNHI